MTVPPLSIMWLQKAFDAAEHDIVAFAASVKTMRENRDRFDFRMFMRCVAKFDVHLHEHTRLALAYSDYHDRLVRAINELRAREDFDLGRLSVPALAEFIPADFIFKQMIIDEALASAYEAGQAEASALATQMETGVRL
jgi:hypothetical protein